MEDKVNLGNLEIHRRQFIIGPRPLLPSKKSWQSRELSSGRILSYQKDLLVTQGMDTLGNQLIMLGLAVQTDPDRKEPFEEALSCTSEIESCYDTWAGRWILIHDSMLHMDFSGLFGCFYLQTEEGFWISSSAALLSELATKANPPEINIADMDMNWYPPPSSRHPQIRSLIPSQIISIDSGKILPRPMFTDEKMALSEEQALATLQRALVTGMKNIAKHGNINIALSSGFDSRLLLATAKAAGVKAKTYTMVKKNTWPFLLRGKPYTSLVNKGDMTLPAKISAKVGIPHTWIHQGIFHPEKLQAFDTHTYRQTGENDRIYLSFGQWDWVSDNDILLLGQVAGMGACYYYKFFSESGPRIPKESLLKHFGMGDDSWQRPALMEYMDWVEHFLQEFPEKADWKDRLYLDQRLGGWASALQQGMDLIPGKKVHLFNTQQFICALLCIPAEKRAHKQFVIELISRMAPELNDFPYNPKDPFLYKLKKTMINMSRNTGEQNMRLITRKLKRKFKRT